MRKTIVIPAELWEYLESIKAETGAPVNELIRRYLVAGLRAEGREPPDVRVQHGGSRPAKPTVD